MSVGLMSLEKKSRLMEAASLQAVSRKGIEQLYLALFNTTGGSPTLRAATSLCKAVKRGSNVVITSGFTIMSARRCETDGLIGSVVIGRLLNKLGVHIAYLTDPKYLSLFETLSEAAGLDSFQCHGFPIRDELAEKEALKAITDFSPAAIIAIERPGWNRKKVYHNMLGEDISDHTARIDHVFNQAHERGILTVGIGDGGNEIGMGNILQAVLENVSYGSVCRCPCRGGIASVTKVDHLVVSSVSNWGSYALTALMASLLNTSFEHSSSNEKKLIVAAVNAGAVDGMTGKSVAKVDGFSADVNADFVTRISRILKE
jgi:hypothetical protein